MTAYDDLLRSLLVERFAPRQETTDSAARLDEVNKGLRSERRRVPRREPNQTNIIESTRRTP